MLSILARFLPIITQRTKHDKTQKCNSIGIQRWDFITSRAMRNNNDELLKLTSTDDNDYIVILLRKVR